MLTSIGLPQTRAGGTARGGCKNSRGNGRRRAIEDDQNHDVDDRTDVSHIRRDGRTVGMLFNRVRGRDHDNLFRAFYNLNFRLNCIITQTRIYFHNELAEEHHKYILPYIHPEQIHSFHVNKENFQYSKFNQCINLRKLKFHSPDHPDLIYVQPSIFPYLKEFKIDVQEDSSLIYSQLCTMIFDNQFPVLQSVCLTYVKFGDLYLIKTWSTSLKHLTIKYCYKSAFYVLIENLPNLIHFDCKFVGLSPGSMKEANLSLRNLTLITCRKPLLYSKYNSSIGLDELFNIYQYLPNLQHTLLYVSDSHRLKTIVDKLNRVLSYCPRLKSFQCVINYCKESSKSIDDIKKRYPLFQNCEAIIWKHEEGIGYGCKITQHSLVKIESK
ncbi:hypothetical protein I4U23_016836 [Adineta vaga]|nr:hypothetical protein I4U23_016836 [Adineta vaga]